MSGSPDPAAAKLGRKYGHNQIDSELANARTVRFLNYLSALLKTQRERGSDYIVGGELTAVDFYWPEFSSLVQIQPQSGCPLDPAVRPMFKQTLPEVAAAVDPVLIEHRDRIMRAHYKPPLEM